MADRRSRGIVERLLPFAFLILSALTVGGWVVDDRQEDADRVALEERLDAREGQVDATTDRLQESNSKALELIEQLRGEGIDPAVKPSELPEPVVADPVTDEQIEAEVVEYFATYGVPVPEVDSDALRVEVTAWLQDHPPAAGRPPTSTEIAAAVRDELAANPPPAGPAGADGVSYVDVRLDGCALVFVRSDGVETRTGPVCGPVGPEGPRGPVGPPGVVDVVTTSSCTEGEGYVSSVNETYDPDTRTITVTCTRSTVGLIPLGDGSP